MNKIPIAGSADQAVPAVSGINRVINSKLCTLTGGISPIALELAYEDQGYGGGYSRVTDFIRTWRAQVGVGSKAFVPLVFECGEAFQFDWSEEGMLVGGVFYKVQVSHMKLCFSRAFWLVAYPTQTHEMLFDAHTRSFTELGGVARRGIYDNMKTAVDKVQRGKTRIVNQRFKALCSHYLFDADFCNVASRWEKGIVEKNVQDSRRRIWIEARERVFGSFVELNTWLAQRCRAVWAETRHTEHPEFTLTEMLETERSSTRCGLICSQESTRWYREIVLAMVRQGIKAIHPFSTEQAI